MRTGGPRVTLPLGGESTARAHGVDRMVIEVGYTVALMSTRVGKKQNHSALFTVCVAVLHHTQLLQLYPPPPAAFSSIPAPAFPNHSPDLTSSLKLRVPLPTPPPRPLCHLVSPYERLRLATLPFLLRRLTADEKHTTFVLTLFRLGMCEGCRGETRCMVCEDGQEMVARGRVSGGVREQGTDRDRDPIRQERETRPVPCIQYASSNP